MKLVQTGIKNARPISIPKDMKLNTVLFADNKVVISYTEHILRRGLYALHQPLQIFAMEISNKKTQVMTFVKLVCKHFHIPKL
jgi:hypothetical protein